MNARVSDTSLTEIIGGEIVEKSKRLEAAADLTERRSDHRIEFGFEFRGLPVAVRAEARNQGTDMEVWINLGVLPYTAQDPMARHYANVILKAAAKDMGGRVRLIDGQRVVFTDSIRIEEPLTPVVLVSRTTRLILEFKPYMELLSVFVRPPLRNDPKAA